MKYFMSVFCEVIVEIVLSQIGSYFLRKFFEKKRNDAL